MSPAAGAGVREYPLGRVEDFPEGSRRVVQVGGRGIGVFNIRGRFYGLPNLCPHQQGPLCEGRRPPHGTTVASAETNWETRWAMDGEVIACPWHGIEYHVPTGRCLPFPEIRLRTYAVEVRDGEVVIQL